jgi:hypothetical protein
MSFFSASQCTSIPVNVPMCDAWGYFGVGTSVSTIDQSGIASFTKTSAGKHQIQFQNPSRFSSGAYVVVCTPEFRNDSGYGPNYGPIRHTIFPTSLGHTGTNPTDSSSNVRFNTYTYQGFNAGGGTAQIADHASTSNSSTRVCFAAFSFSRDNIRYSSALNPQNYWTVPGASGYGVTGSFYNSHLVNAFSKRTAIAYGTVVIPGFSGSSNTTITSAYIDRSFNVLGVSAGGISVFDIVFKKPLNSSDYCVILSGEYETNQTSLLPTIPSTNEVSELIVRAGSSGQFKTKQGFRIESLKQLSTNNSWTNQNIISRSGLTERIHFMVFGGATYGQP